MDVFALHIPMHQVPAPLVTMLTAFLLVPANHVAVAERTPPFGCGLGAPALTLAAVLALAAPVPADLQDLRGERAPPPSGSASTDTRQSPRRRPRIGASTRQDGHP